MANVIQWQGVSYNNKPYPGWAEFLGWLMALSSMVLIPAFAIYQLWKTPGTVKEVRILFLNFTCCRSFIIPDMVQVDLCDSGVSTSGHLCPWLGNVYWSVGSESLLVTKCLEI